MCRVSSALPVPAFCGRVAVCIYSSVGARVSARRQGALENGSINTPALRLLTRSVDVTGLGPITAIPRPLRSPAEFLDAALPPFAPPVRSSSSLPTFLAFKQERHEGDPDAHLTSGGSLFHSESLLKPSSPMLTGGSSRGETEWASLPFSRVSLPDGLILPDMLCFIL